MISAEPNIISKAEGLIDVASRLAEGSLW